MSFFAWNTCYSLFLKTLILSCFEFCVDDDVLQQSACIVKVNNKYNWILYFYFSLSQNILKVWYFTKLEHPKYEEGFKISHKTMKYYCKCVNMLKTKWFRKIAQKNLNKVLNYYHCCFMKFCVTTSFMNYYIQMLVSSLTWVADMLVMKYVLFLYVLCLTIHNIVVYIIFWVSYFWKVFLLFLFNKNNYMVRFYQSYV